MVSLVSLRILEYFWCGASINSSLRPLPHLDAIQDLDWHSPSHLSAPLSHSHPSVELLLWSKWDKMGSWLRLAMGQRLWETGQSPIQFQSVSSALFQEKSYMCVITRKEKRFLWFVCCTIHPSCLFILYITCLYFINIYLFCISKSDTPSHPSLFPLHLQPLVCSLRLWVCFYSLSIHLFYFSYPMYKW